MQCHQGPLNRWVFFSLNFFLQHCFLFVSQAPVSPPREQSMISAHLPSKWPKYGNILHTTRHLDVAARRGTPESTFVPLFAVSAPSKDVGVGRWHLKQKVSGSGEGAIIVSPDNCISRCWLESAKIVTCRCYGKRPAQPLSLRPPLSWCYRDPPLVSFVMVFLSTHRSTNSGVGSAAHQGKIAPPMPASPRARPLFAAALSQCGSTRFPRR